METKQHFDQVEKLLTDYNKSEVKRYVNYLSRLVAEKDREGKSKNPWIKFFTPEHAADIFSKVAIDNLLIDGETITLQFKGKVMVSYGYQAYKNRVLSSYPESIFDIQLVKEGDEFSFRKESGKVLYTHIINNAFNPSPVFIGAYVVIKNNRGEFLELLNMTDVEKMKSKARTKVVWDEWFSQMILKSAIKRACKLHFFDITKNIEKLDNENYDMDMVDLDESIAKQIESAKTFIALNQIYKKEKATIKDEVSFIQKLKDRKEELIALLPEITKKEIPDAVKMLVDGKQIKDLLMIWKINEEQQNKIIEQSI